MLAFMNQMFGFSGSRDEKIRKQANRPSAKSPQKSYPQLQRKTMQHENIGLRVEVASDSDREKTLGGHSKTK